MENCPRERNTLKWGFGRMKDWNKIYKKTIGKVYSYLGLIIAIAGTQWLIPELIILGIIILIIGCTLHEVNET